MYVSFIGYSKPDGALAQKVRNGLIKVATNLRVVTCKSPAIAVAKAISTVAKLNKKHEDSKHMIATIWFMVIKKHLILNNAMLIDSIYYTWQQIGY